jgi:ribosomal protein S18 acetylase RimI-like enzyme
MSYKDVSVRRATMDDSCSIAQVHVESTRATYRSIFSEAYLAGLSVEGREAFWRQILGRPESITLVGCESGGLVVGFANGGAERTGRLECDGELYAIYLLFAAQRQGVGTLLVRRFARELIERGFRSMAVWVLAENPSRKFYEALGGRVIAEKEIERDGRSHAEIAYGWRDLSGLEKAKGQA